MSDVDTHIEHEIDLIPEERDPPTARGSCCAPTTATPGGSAGAFSEVVLHDDRTEHTS